jgi:HlyD family secretion protein
MKKIVGILIILALAGGGAYYYYKYAKPVEKPQVMQVKVSRGDIIEVVNATGTLEPMRRVDVGSQVSGVVQEIFVDYNHIVKQGQVLAKIDPSLLQVQVEIQEANIERQQMEIENQKVQLEDLKVKLARAQALFDKQLVNQQQLDEAALAVKNRDAQIASQQKQMVQSEANLRQAKLNVSYTTIVSPIDGVVVERRVDRGQTVQSSMNAPTFFALATDLRTLRLSAGVDEADIGRVEVGQKVMFKVDAYGGQEFEGTVDTVRLNATNTNNVVTYPVWIRVPNPELKLRPAMTATLRVIIQTATNVVRVPNQALRFRPNNDIYTALGIEPPAAGRGRSLASELNDTNGAGPGRAQGAGPGQTATTPPGGQQATPQGGQQGRERTPGGGGQGGSRQPGDSQNRQGGTGFGRQTGMGNLTPEQIQQFREKFGRSGGGNRGAGGGGRGGGGRGQGGRGANAAQNTAAPPVELDATKIDELFAPVQRPEQRASVYTYDGSKTPAELKQLNIRLGVTDGTFSELLSDNLQVEQQLVTGVILPMAQRPNQPGQSIFGQPQRGMGGMTPGDRGGPGGGGPGGGGNPGGGGGGGGGGRGGGGRGGGN